MSIVEDILDLLAFIVVLGACLGVAFGIVLPIVYEEDTTSSILVDKTSPTVEGLVVEGEYDGKLSKMEVILLTQIQDDSMPRPQKFTIKSPTGGSDALVDIDTLGPLYRSGVELSRHGNMAISALTGDTNTSTRYEIVYDTGANPNSKEDDSYIIRKSN